MPYEIQDPPATEKDGLINAVKMIANRFELLVGPNPHGQLENDIKCQLHGLIDDLSPKRVKFCWMTKNARRRNEAAHRNAIGRFCLENPGMCD